VEFQDLTSMRFFDPKLLNGPAGDPALYVELTGEGRSLLFDCGRLGRLKPAQALRLSDLFITHTHIDHFIGFDQLVRLLLGSDRHLRVWGPPGIIDNVRGRLAGYTWNLVDGQELVIEAVEFGEETVRRRTFLCCEAFVPGDEAEAAAAGAPGLAFEDAVIEVRWTALDHIIPSLAFSLTEKDRWNVDEGALREDGMEPGPWVGDLKRAVETDAPGEQVLETPAGPRALGRLRDRYVRLRRGEKLSYVADSLFSGENLERILPLVENSDVLYCEGGFLSDDEAKARDARHLTARQAGEIARRARCARVEIFHFSPKYLDRHDQLRRECEDAFRGGEAT
jgi:ribonuclease Z